MVSPQRACLAASFRDDSRHCLQHSWPYHRASIQQSCANWPWAKVFPACEDQAGWSQDGWCSCQPCSMVCRPANSLRSPEKKHVTLWKLWGLLQTLTRLLHCYMIPGRSTCFTNANTCIFNNIYQNLALTPLPRNPHHSRTPNPHRHPFAWSSWSWRHAGLQRWIQSRLPPWCHQPPFAPEQVERLEQLSWQPLQSCCQHMPDRCHPPSSPHQRSTPEVNLGDWEQKRSQRKCHVIHAISETPTWEWELASDLYKHTSWKSS